MPNDSGENDTEERKWILKSFLIHGWVQSNNIAPFMFIEADEWQWKDFFFVVSEMSVFNVAVQQGDADLCFSLRRAAHLALNSDWNEFSS